MYIYIRSDPNLYTVGFYDPSGKWKSESNHSDKEEAAKRVHWLNGGQEESDRPSGEFDKPSSIYDR